MSKNQVALIQKDITDQVNSKVEELQNEGLSLPDNYNYSNALKSAFFALQEVKAKGNQPALQVCTRESIANTLLDMVTQGLSPAKNQNYFVVYGDQLTMQRSYFGTQAVLKRLSSVDDIWANVIFEGDDFEISINDGRERLAKHETSWKNRDNNIEGAYAVIKQQDGDEIVTVMTMKEIQTAWNQSKTGQGVHKKFPQEMAKRTVINRAAKNYINTSNDSDLLVDAINRTTENEFADDTEIARRDVTADIKQNANQEIIDFAEPEEQGAQNDNHEQVLTDEEINVLKQGRPIEATEEQETLFNNLSDLDDPGY